MDTNDRKQLLRQAKERMALQLQQARDGAYGDPRYLERTLDILERQFAEIVTDVEALLDALEQEG